MTLSEAPVPLPSVGSWAASRSWAGWRNNGWADKSDNGM